MVVKPKVKGFICTTAHPVGCEEGVRRQIDVVKRAVSSDMDKTSETDFHPKRVLVIGGSAGYGLASRIAVTYGYGADTIGVSFEKEAKGKRTATAGWYNTKAFDKLASADGYKSISFNGDGFSSELKHEVADAIRDNWGQADMVIYSMAAPRRTMPDGTRVTSVLKTVGEPFTNKTIDLRTNEITDVSVPVATDDEIADTIKVMGGEDWKDWIELLYDEGVLAEGAVTLAYSYIGPRITHAIYKEGSIGQAKKDLYATAKNLTHKYEDMALEAYVSVNKALVTQSSAAIPVVPLYISLLYKVMKEKGVHEGCIEQMARLYLDKLPRRETDDDGLIRLDDLEMAPEIQRAVNEQWESVTTKNIKDVGDIDGYLDDFYHIFGFGYDNVDYTEDVDI